MPIVIPAILEKTVGEVEQRIHQLDGLVDTFQLDVMDGEFVPNITVNDPALLTNIKMPMEVHLMVGRPDLTIRRWLLNNVQRLIVHIEAASNMEEIISAVKGGQKEVGIAINPTTSTYVLKNYLDKIDLVLIMGVNPGFSGQNFSRDVLEKIKEVKMMNPKVLVEVDGGVNGRNCRVIANAGADILVSASFLWQADNLGQALEILQKA